MACLDRKRARLRSRRQGSAWVIVLIALGLVSVVAGIGYFLFSRSAGEEAVPMVLADVTRGPFEFVVIAQGELESSANVEIRCEVKSRGGGSGSGTVILDVIPEGTSVKEGDVLVTLDSTALQQEMVTQQISCNTSKAAVVQTQNLYEASLLGKKEYEEGTFRQEEQRILSERFVAQENLRRAQQYERYSERLAAKGYVTALQLEGDRFAVDNARNGLEAADTSLNVLREYTRRKMVKELDSQIASTKAAWEAEQSTYQLELDKLSDLKDQIAKCEVRATSPGTVVYANEFSSRGNAEFIVEPGAVARENQVLIRLPDSDQMQVKAKVNEARITLIQRENLPVTIKLDALNGQILEGRLVRVKSFPEPRSWSSGTIREYAAFTKILDPPPNIRPGMNAEVQILVERQEDALQTPVQAMCEHKGKYFCLVVDGERPKTVEVEVGSSNDRTMTIKSGLSEGDKVVMNPRGYPQFLDLPDLPDPSPTARLPAVARAQGAPSVLGETSPGKKKSGRPSVGEMVRQTMALDADGDGFLSAEELKEMPADRRERTMKSDTDADGKISRAELTVGISQRMRARKAREGGGGGGPGGGSGGGAE